MEHQTLMVVFAQRHGEIVHVDAVPNGHACECTCLNCGRPLNAKNEGAVRQHHFAHQSGQDCAGALETAIHEAAKAALAEASSVVTPAIKVEVVRTDASGQPHHAAREIPASEVGFDRVSTEVDCGGFRPDAIGYVGARRLAIEVHVTHEVDAEKTDKVRELDLPMIELFLDGLHARALQDWTRFRRYVVADAPRRWIHNPRIAHIRNRLTLELEQRVSAINERLARQAEARAWQQAQEARLEARKRAERQQRRRALRDEHLPTLHAVVQLSRNVQRWQRLREKALPEARKRLSALGVCIDPYPGHLDAPVSDEWIFNAHRIRWQSAVYERFISNSAPQTLIRSRDIRRWVVRNIGLHPLVARLIALRTNAWHRTASSYLCFLSPEENKAVPDSLRPVREFLNVLSDVRLLHPLGEGRYRVLYRSLEEMRADVVLRGQSFASGERRIPGHTELTPEDEAALERLAMQRAAALAVWDQHLYDALKRPAQTPREQLDGHYLADVLQCQRCYFSVPPAGGDFCPYCSSQRLVEKRITDYTLYYARVTYNNGGRAYQSLRALAQLPTPLARIVSDGA